MPVRILISDDSPIFRRTLRHMLEAADEWQIIETRDGGEAVSQTLATLPDVVILDLAMPVKDGLAAAREIVQALPNTPVLMCTMHNSPQVELEAKKAGARGILSKENSTAIVAVIRQLLGSRISPPENGQPAKTPLAAAIPAVPISANIIETPVESTTAPPDPKRRNEA